MFRCVNTSTSPCRLGVVFCLLWLWGTQWVVGAGEFNVSAQTWPMKFKMGLLAPWNATFEDFSALTSASAISIAIEDIHNDDSFGGRIQFEWVTKDTACKSKTAAGNAVRMYIEDKVDAFIGPPCSIACKPVAELAAFWNLPIISWVATDIDFNQKDIFSTLGRTLGPFSKMGNYLLEICQRYSWRRVVVISSNYLLWLDAGKAITKVFKDNNMTIAYQSEYDRFPTDSYIRDTLTKTKEEGRIVFLISPKEDRRRIMLRALDMGMCEGDYVFFTIEMLPEENVIDGADIWASSDGRDADARRAFESVFHVVLAALTDKEVNKFRMEVAARMRKSPWVEYTSTTDMSSAGDFTMGDKFSAFLYDAVYLYAMAINESISKGLNPRNGTNIFGQIRGKYFKGMTGNVVLDQNGDREADFWITDLMPNGSFVRIAEVLNSDGGIRIVSIVVTRYACRKGMTGNLVLDKVGDREPDFWITDLMPNGSFVKIAEVLNTDGGARVTNNDIAPPRWPGGKVGHQFAPPDVPVCGFQGEKCPKDGVPDWGIALIVVVVCLAIAGVSGLAVFIYRRSRFEADLLLQSWKVRWEDIEPLKSGKSTRLGGSTPTLSNGSNGSASGLKLQGSINPADISKNSSQSRSMPSVGTGGGQIFTDVGLYKGLVVSIKHIKKEHIQVSRTVLLEFNELKDIIQENVNIFVGACVDPPNLCLVWTYCAKGSLQDVLENDSVKLDSLFKLSFMTDLAKGMLYLHASHLGSHGNLKSSNCLIDARWVLKITDYGLPSFLSGQEFQENEDDQYKRKLWTAPEILRENFPTARGTQKGDVYSFAIICYEIMQRSQPYCFDNITPRDVVNRVRNGESIPYRPQLPPTTDLGRPVIQLIQNCWDETVDRRPSFSQIRSMLRKITGGEINIMDNILGMMDKYAFNLEEIVTERTQQLEEEKKKTDRLLYKMLPSINIMENVLCMMEKYAFNLEELVEERTVQLVEEKKKTDGLLFRMLPSSVAEQLKAGKFVQPENYDQATIYFSDIVGFTTLASDSNPMQIVDFLNDLYSCFDDIIAQHDVYKVETIGDAYMVVSGVPVRNGIRHTAEIANVSLDLLSSVTHFKIRHRPHEKLQLRIGLHTGPVVAGVVGLIMPRYCLFGDTVNMAARMESSGKPLRIHISKQIYIALCETKFGYEMTTRGEMNVKGKGLQMTYWLHGKTDYVKPLPKFDRVAVQKETKKHNSEDEEADGGNHHHALMQGYDTLSAPKEDAGSMPKVV